MGILSHNLILKAISEKEIIITPFDPNQVKRASIDLHIGNKFLDFKHSRSIIKIAEDIEKVEPEILTETVTVTSGNFLMLYSGDIVIGFTKEFIALSKNLCGWIVGRGRFAKFGLFVEVASGFVQPGTSDKALESEAKQLYLQIMNVGKYPIALYPGTSICQLVIQKVECS